MADLARLESALIKADAAGDVDGARVLAAEIRKARSAAPKQMTVNDPAAAEVAAGVGAGMGVGERTLVGIGSAFADLGRGVGQLTGSVSEADVADARKREEGLGTAGKVGKFLGNVATFLPTLAIPGANTLTGAALTGAGMGLLTPTAEGESRTMNTGLGAAGGAVGKVVGDKVASTLTNRLAATKGALTTGEIQNAGRDATLAASRADGYVIPPSAVNTGNTNRVIESLGGKAATAQMASNRNQTVTNMLARKALGMPKDTQLDDAVLDGIRKTAGQAYEAIKSLPTRFQTDIHFTRDINALGKDFAVAAQEFPEIAKNEAVQTLQSALSKQDMSPQAAIELIKKLRFDAGKNFKAFDDPAKASLAVAQRGAADAIEAMIERNLATTGNANLVPQFRQARTLIAKAHDVEAALLPDGNVSAKVIAKIAGNKSLTGELSAIAKFAGSFERAAQNPAQASGAGVSNLQGITSFGLGGLGGLASGDSSGWSLGALPFIMPPAARSLMLSKAYQNMAATPNYTPGVLQRLVTEFAQRGAPYSGIVGAETAK